MFVVSTKWGDKVTEDKVKVSRAGLGNPKRNVVFLNPSKYAKLLFKKNRPALRNGQSVQKYPAKNYDARGNKNHHSGSKTADEFVRGKVALSVAGAQPRHAAS